MMNALALVLLLFGAPLAPAAEPLAPDALFERGQYQEALKGYEALLQDPAPATSLQSLYRAAECEGLLFRYGEAAQRIFTSPLPTEPTWKARFLILRSELGREFLKQYGRAAPRDAEEGTEDLAKRTPDEWREMIRAAYQGLWEMRAPLAGVALSGEGYFVDLKDADLEGTPTLWDFVVLRLSEYLLTQAPDATARPEAQRFLRQDFDGKLSWDDPPAAIAGALLEDASRLAPAPGPQGLDRDEARGIWKVRRVMIPFKHSDRVSRSEDSKSDAKLAVDLLRRWQETFKGLAAAQAGLEAARLLNDIGQPDEAADLCRAVESRWPGSTAAKFSAKLRSEIELPELHLTARFAPPPGANTLTLTTRNLDRVHLRLYRVTPEELKAGSPDRWMHGWTALRRPDPKLIERFARRGPLLAWDTVVRSSSPYTRAQTRTDPPPLAPGLYLALASSDPEFRPGASMLAATVVNVTELFLIATAGPQAPDRDLVFDPAGPAEREVPGFHLYAMDAVSGRPRAAHVSAFRQQRWSEWSAVSADLDDAGIARLPVTLKLSDAQASNFALDPLASFKDSYAYLAYPSSLHFSPASPIEVHLETDRPIYRPGQEVAVKATVLARIPRGYKTYDGKAQLTIKAQDPNGVEFFTKTLPLGPMGSAAARFTLPTGRPLGRYGLTATIQEFGQTRYGWAYYAVEEYKRPEFEVLVQEATGPWKYGAPAVVAGEAKYYFGGPVADASVGYKVYREDFLPWWCWWWRGLGSRRGRAVVASGSARTDAGGKFSLGFTPQPPDDAGKDPGPSTFSVEVEARDPGGRTITALRTFRAGAKAYLVSMTPSAGFAASGKKASVEVKLLTLDEKPVAGGAAFELRRVEGEPKETYAEPYWGGRFRDSPPLEAAFKDAPDGALVRGGDLRVKADQPAKAELGALKTGIYRFTVRAKDPWGGQVEQSIILVAAGEGDRLALKLPPVAIPEHPSYLPGETARVLLGSRSLKGAVYVELWAGPCLAGSRVLDGGGVRVIDVPVTQDHKGGLWLRWFSARDFKVDSAQTSLQVPWRDKELAVGLEHDKVLRPGQKASWRLSVSARDKKPVAGEAVVRIFDRSLEYYMEAEKPWSAGLYPAKGRPNDALGSLFTPDVSDLPVTEGWVRKMLDLFREVIAEPSPPMLRINKSRVPSRNRLMMKSARMDREESMPMEVKSMVAMKSDGAGALAGPAAPMAKEKAGDAAPAPAADMKARSDFSETALFEPQLKVASGRAGFSFKVPERLTSWKIQASVLTRDVKRGEVSAQAVTQRDLMVRLELPRFLREGDAGTLKAVVNNETETELAGEATLSVEEDGRAAAGRLALAPGSLTRPFRVKPHGAAALAWPVKAPKGLGDFKIKAIARAGALVDGEEKDLPILPSRSRLIESALVSLDGTAKKEIRLPSFDDADPTRRHESMTLQLDPQLALSVLNSLPSLVHYPFECVESTLERYVPLGIVNAFYKKHPGLAEAVKKIPKRDTITPAWDRSDPRRLAGLMETPWVRAAEGRKSAWPIVDLFDPATVKGELADSLAKLLASQNADGSFPWFAGGRPDPYITLVVLSGFAEARRYGIDIPREQAGRALAYVAGEIPKRLKPDFKPDESSVSLLLYAAYVVTSFDKGVGDVASLRDLALAWVDYADKHAQAMTPIGKAYAAHVYWRLGLKAKGDSYLERAMDGARSDPVAGVFWAPEKLSWLWYNDSVEKHAFLLRTLLQASPKDPRIPGMIQWLLFNRKGNEWKSTKASAAAIYSLLDVLKTRGALDRGDDYVVAWGADTHAASVAPLDWLAQPLRWTKTGMDIGPKQGAASLSKEGPGLGFASLTWVYTTDRPVKASGAGLMRLGRKFFKRVQEGPRFTLKPLRSGDTVAVGDQIEVRLAIETRSQFEYAHLKDPRLAGFEAEELLSGWKWDGLSRYEEPRDSLTNFFLDWIPHGEYVLGYRVRPTAPGAYRVGPAVLQSMYAPEMAAHSDSFELNVAP
ncbi:MAG: hypothetical protein HY927_05110 [Elusimicrobia bacterium]|nr:hypothetical protein [Elusimicrobiota bacterium]